MESAAAEPVFDTTMNILVNALLGKPDKGMYMDFHPLQMINNLSLFE